MFRLESASYSSFFNGKHSCRNIQNTKIVFISVSLLLALLSLIFLLKISPGTKNFHNVQQNLLGTSVEEYAIVFDVTLALCALSLSLNLCCLLVCAIQFLFAVKLVGATPAVGRYVLVTIYLVILVYVCVWYFFI